MQLQQEKQIAKSDLLRKCGLLAHTSPAFLKNCWIKKLFFRLRLVAYSQSSKKAAASSQEVAAFFAKYPKNKMVRCKTLLHFLQLKFHHFSRFCCIQQLFSFYLLRIQHFKNNRLLTFNQQLSIIMTVRQRTSIIRQLSFFTERVETE